MQGPVDWNDNIENDNRVEEFKDEIHEKISEEEIEENANIVDGAEKEKDQISKDNMLKTEEIDLDIASNDTFVMVQYLIIMLAHSFIFEISGLAAEK